MQSSLQPLDQESTINPMRFLLHNKHLKQRHLCDMSSFSGRNVNVNKKQLQEFITFVDNLINGTIQLGFRTNNKLILLYKHYIKERKVSNKEQLDIILLLISTDKFSKSALKECIEYVIHQCAHFELDEIDQSIELVRLCLSKKMIDAAMHVGFTFKEYVSSVLRGFFEVIDWSLLADEVMQQIEETAYSSRWLTEHEELDTALSEIDGGWIAYHVAQCFVIFDNQCLPPDGEFQVPYCEFIQTMFFKKIVTDMMSLQLNVCIVILNCLAWTFYLSNISNYVMLLVDLFSMKQSMMVMDRITVDLVLNLCQDQLTSNDWIFILERIPKTARIQFIRYVKFVYGRLTSKNRDKTLVLSKSMNYEQISVKAKEYLDIWTLEENKTLLNNIQLIMNVLSNKDLLEEDMTEINYNLLNASLHLHKQNVKPEWFDHVEDYSLLFDIRDMSFIEHMKVNKDKFHHYLINNGLHVEDMNENKVIRLAEQFQHLLSSFHQCVHPPMSIQALTELSNKENMICGTTKVSIPLLIEHEIDHLSPSLIDQLKKRFKGKASLSLMFSRYYCDSCNQAYKHICGENTDDVKYNYTDVIEKYLHAKQKRKDVTEDKVLSPMFVNACLDMRMLHRVTCNSNPDDEHYDQILSGYKNKCK